MPHTPPHATGLPPAPAVRATRSVAIACTLALVLLGLAWELALAPLRPGGSWWALKVLPLVAPLTGLARLRLYTYRWTSLLVWLYFAEGVVRATSEPMPAAGLAAAQAALAVVLFAACIVHVRARFAAARVTPDAATAPPPAASR
jgi:uncharacterized membrane protein